MTEEEKDRLRVAKAEVTEALASAPIDEYRLREVDPRLDQYVRDVASDPGGHNVFEQLAVARFLRLADRYGINVTEVKRFFVFY